MHTVPITGELRGQVLEALGQVPLFQALDAEDRVRVVDSSKLLQLEPGEALTRQGAPSDSLYVLLRGRAAVMVAKDGSDDLVEIGRLNPPESLGEVGLLLDTPRTATVVALEPALALRFDAVTFRPMYNQIPNFGFAISRGLAHRLELLTHRLPVSRVEPGRLPDPGVVSMIPLAFLQRHRVLPLEVDGNVLVLGFVDAPSRQVIGGAQQFVPGMELRPVAIDARTFDAALSRTTGLAWEGSARPATPTGPRSERLDALVDRMIAEGASDLHLAAGHRPRWRIDGDIRELADAAVLDRDDVWTLIEPILDDRNHKEFAEHHDTDLGYSTTSGARVRLNLFRDSLGTNAAVRLIPSKIMSFEQLGLPKVLKSLCLNPQGLILVTGPTGCGKSTTLAAMVDSINRARPVHIVTIEAPIEFVHRSDTALVQQREVGSHTMSFARAVRAALREDPDVLLIGELRDVETMTLALEAAATGHLVFATLHTSSAVTTVDRIVGAFPPERQSQVRTALGESLRGVVCQTLCRRTKGGRSPAVEVMVVNRAISHLILEGKTTQIPNTMATAKSLGNQELNDALEALVRQHLVEYEEALLKTTDRKDLARRLNRTL
jgi:twitching motility protein PilT